MPHPIILLVEDDPSHAALIQWCLESQPVTLHHTQDGEEALDYLLNQGPYAAPAAYPRPHLIMLDLNLPKISGFEVLDRINASASLRSIPVVILSTSNSPNDIAKAYALGAVSYIVKPTELDTFMEALNFLCKNWLPKKEKA